ncbi:MAG TPA: hypothetical protein VJU16_04070 [Planctomycetota bacterium]|nr:hypothetical protein [Planctomycetota bacterium]
MDWKAISSEACFKVSDDTGIGFTTVMRRVSVGMAAVAQGAGRSITVLEAVDGVVRPALRGVSRAGADYVMGTKAIVMGVIWGAGRKKGAALKILTHTVRAVIRQTAVRRGDVGAAVTGLVRGAIASSRRMGVATDQAAIVVTSAAIDEVYRLGSTKPESIRLAQ